MNGSERTERRIISWKAFAATLPGVVTVKQAKVRGENTLIGIASDGVSLTQALPLTEIESILLTSGKEEQQTITLVLQCNYLGVVFPLGVKVRLAGGGGKPGGDPLRRRACQQRPDRSPKR